VTAADTLEQRREHREQQTTSLYFPKQIPTKQLLILTDYKYAMTISTAHFINSIMLRKAFVLAVQELQYSLFIQEIRLKHT